MITHIHAHRVYQYTLIAFCAVLAALFVGVALTRADDHLGVGTELVSTIEDAAVETKTESTDDGAVVVSEGALIPPPVPRRPYFRKRMTPARMM